LRSSRICFGIVIWNLSVIFDFTKSSYFLS
jgi:hypothetical protein